MILQCDSDALKFLLESPNYGEGLFNSANFYVLGCDITNTSLMQEILLEKCMIDFSKPTFILAECVLTYIAPTK